MSQAASGTSWVLRASVLAGVASLTYIGWLLRDTIGLQGQSALGIICFLGFVAAFSANLRQVHWRTVITGIVLQFMLGVLILKVPFVYEFFTQIGNVVVKFLQFADQGARFVFGPLADLERTEYAFGKDKGFIFVVRALPTVIFVSAVFTVLYHLRILQFVVWIFAQAMLLILGRKSVSGAETLAAAANVFMGQTEAPLIIKPYVLKMTQSELLALMIGGMATIAGGIMAVYIEMGADRVAILATSVMAAPCGLYLSKLLLPETEEPLTRGSLRMADEKTHANVIDAAAGGASEGMMLVLNICAMLIAFIAGIAMVNYGIQLIAPEWSLERIFSVVFAPLAFLMGVESDDIGIVAKVLGEKLVLNEFVSFAHLTSDHFKNGEVQRMSERSYRLAVFALTGFANFASIGIQLGGIGAMAPERRKDIAQLGMRALLGGFAATLINASIAGLLLK